MTQFDVLVTGAASPLGDHTIPALLSTGRTVAVTARSDETEARLRSTGVHVIRHDLEQGERLTEVEADTLLHIAGVRFPVAQLVTDIGASHVVAVSSASATAPGHPQREELLTAEHRLAASSPSAAVLRPTMIYGSARDTNVQRLYRLIQRLPLVPRFSGGGLIMPVLVDDLVAAILETISTRDEATRAVGGPAPVRLGDLVDAICRVTGSRRTPVTVPIGALSRAARFKPGVPSKRVHAVQMLAVDRVVETPAQAGFSYTPTPLGDGVALAVARYTGN